MGNLLWIWFLISVGGLFGVILSGPFWLAFFVAVIYAVPRLYRIRNWYSHAIKEVQDYQITGRKK